MSSIGRMDGAFFVSRGELLAWVNSAFRLNLTKVEQCSNGAVYCQVIDACHPGAVAMKKVNWAAKADHESIPNYKVLQQAFDRCQVSKHIEVDKLVRGKYQDNLEMLQWIKTYFDRTSQGGDYDPLARRFTENLPDWARAVEGYGGCGAAGVGGRRESARDSETPGRPQNQGTARASRESRDAGLARHGAPVVSAAEPSGRRSPGAAAAAAAAAEADCRREEHERLREEVVDLKITVDGLETERDFYFQKLRDIEILCQALEAHPDPNMTVSKFVEDVQRILYAKDEEEMLGDAYP